MSRVLVVDGYNIISDWPQLKTLKRDNLEAARYTLCELLEDYIPYPWAYIVVVFDGHKVSGGKKAFENQGKVQVVYTGEGETADLFIEKLTAGAAGKVVIEVATSDLEEQRGVFVHGAVRLSSRELALRLTEEKEVIRSIYTDMNREGARRSLDEVLPPDLRERLERMRRQK